MGAVPGRGEVDDPDLPAGGRVEDGRGPAHPVVHDGGVVLGTEDHRRSALPHGDGQGVGADAGLVPATAGHEVHRLRLAPHHPAAVGPQDPGVGVGHRDDEVAVLCRTPQLALDRGHCPLQRRVPPRLGGVALVGQRRLRDVGRDRLPRELPAAQDLRTHQRARVVALLDERRPGPDRGESAVLQVLVVWQCLVVRLHDGSRWVGAVTLPRRNTPPDQQTAVATDPRCTEGSVATASQLLLVSRSRRSCRPAPGRARHRPGRGSWRRDRPRSTRPPR